MERRKAKRGKRSMERESHVPLGPCKFVCDLLMVESVKCATKKKGQTKRKDLVVESHLKAGGLNISRPTQPQSGNPLVDKSVSTVLKISVDLWPVLTRAIEPQMDPLETSHDELKNEQSEHLNEKKTDKQLTEVRPVTVNQEVKLSLQQPDKPMGGNILPPLKSTIIQPFNSDKYLKKYSTLPPIPVSEKHLLDFVDAKSKIEKEHEEQDQTTRFPKADSVKNILSENMAPQLHLPDISVSSIQILLERVERQLDRGKVRLPEIKLPQAQKAVMSARKSHSPPLHGKNKNQPIILRFHKVHDFT